jgi:hypothetical protein
MSYARLSSGYADPELNSDVYVYDDTSGGITIHVASHRYSNTTLLKPFTNEIALNLDALREYTEERIEWFASATLIPIGLPYDGISLYNLDPEDAIAFLELLLKTGYWLHHRIIDELKYEYLDNIHEDTKENK